MLEKLYSLNVLNRLNEQRLPLKEEMDYNFVFYQIIRKACGIRIAHELQLMTASIRYQIVTGSGGQEVVLRSGFPN